MATTEQIEELKVLLGAALGSYTDVQLSALLDAATGNVNQVAARVWSSFAASSASLVNVSESGSSRSLGDVYKNALAMSKYYQGLDEAAQPVIDSSRPRTRAIVRA